jgi:putative ABC transport system substrate-binding protein
MPSSSCGPVKRRDVFAALLAVAAIMGARPLSAHAQQARQSNGGRRVGVLMNLSESDPAAQGLISTFRDGLTRLGWREGHNLQIDYRWSGGDVERIRKYASELVALKPDVILAYGGSVVGPLLKVSGEVPIVFTEVVDPIADGFIASLAHPGGTATGFSLIDFGIAAKWLELLKQVAPGSNKVVVLKQSSSPGAIGQLNARRDVIISLSARYKVPTVYPLRYFAVSGGLISYGPDRLEPYRHAAVYVDRVLKGEKPADLPVQQPTKYELVINLKTAQMLGLSVPPTLLALADEVIE